MSARLAAPHADSYWIPRPEGVVAAGEYPGDLNPERAREKIAAILDAGITCFVDLTEHNELRPYQPMLEHEASARGVTIQHIRRPIRDMGVCGSAEMSATIETIHAAVTSGQKVYVHCWGGVGRTGTVVGCWLVEQGMQPADALAMVDTLFHTMSPAKVARHPEGSPQTDAQRAVVRGWARSVRKRGATAADG